MSLVGEVDRLEERKLVRRNPNPDDRRSFVIQLTSSGKRAATRVAHALGELERELARRVEKSDLTGLDRVTRALETIVKPTA